MIEKPHEKRGNLPQKKINMVIQFLAFIEYYTYKTVFGYFTLFLPNTTARVSVAFRSLSSFLICKLCLLFFLHAVAFLIICDFCRNLLMAEAELGVFSTNLTLFTFGDFSL